MKPLHRIDPRLELPAITIKQPDAELILCGDKLVENRTWRTKYRGDLVIHAGRDDVMTRRHGGMAGAARAYGRPFKTEGYDPQPTFAALVGVVRLVDVVPLHELRERGGWSGWSGDLDERYCWGPYCWLLADVRRFPQPITQLMGRLGLWPVRRSSVPGTPEHAALSGPPAFRPAWTPRPVDPSRSDRVVVPLVFTGLAAQAGGKVEPTFGDYSGAVLHRVAANLGLRWPPPAITRKAIRSARVTIGRYDPGHARKTVSVGKR